MTNFRDQINAIYANINRIQDVNQIVVGERNAWRDRAERFRAELEQLREQFDGLSTAYDAACDVVTDKNAEIEQLRAERDEWEAHAEAESEEVERKKESLTEYWRKIKDLKAERHRLWIQKEIWRNAYKQVLKRAELAEAERDSFRDDIFRKLEDRYQKLCEREGATLGDECVIASELGKLITAREVLEGLL